MKHVPRAFAAAVIAGCLIASGGLCSAGELSQGKTLMVYYSRSGNTRAACEALQKELGADIREVLDVNTRGKGFPIIAAMFKIVLGMQTGTDPASVDLAPYDRIIISAPIWAANFGLAMRTFVERNSFAGKDVIIFITSDSFVEEKHQQKHTELVAVSGGNVIGYFQVQAADLVDGEKVPRTQEKIVEEAMKLVPEIKACMEGKK